MDQLLIQDKLQIPERGMRGILELHFYLLAEQLIVEEVAGFLKLRKKVLIQIFQGVDLIQKPDDLPHQSLDLGHNYLGFLVKGNRSLAGRFGQGEPDPALLMIPMIG
jgi:hypothetical protein